MAAMSRRPMGEQASMEVSSKFLQRFFLDSHASCACAELWWVVRYGAALQPKSFAGAAV